MRPLLLIASALLAVAVLSPPGLTRGVRLSGSDTALAVRVAAAGDIACDAVCGQQQTAALLERGRYDAILALGDLQYGGATLDLFRRWYGTSWGRPTLKAVTHPAPGNHEYENEGAAGYFAYFGAAAGRPGAGWYSFDLGAWHLAGSSARCTLAYWHHPRYSSGLHGDDPRTADLWSDLAAAHAELVLNGHDHDYERFAPRSGLRELVVGTGGKSHYPLRPIRETGSQSADDRDFGVLELTLRRAGYEWRFLRTDGRVGDRGRGVCH
jgi:hypothetical protein